MIKHDARRSNYYEKKVKAITSFDYTLDYENINMREHPELYRIGRGEQGVLMVQPYKSEILPHRRFKTPAIATRSAQTIYGIFLMYLEDEDFVGADMARKYLQMGRTRSRRYANHSSGKKYQSNPQLAQDPSEEKKLKATIRPQESDALTSEKTQSAAIFYEYYTRAKDHAEYIRQKQIFKDTYYPKK